MLTFTFDTDKEALHEINNGTIDKDIFEHLKDTKGFIVWGKENKRLDCENVYQLFEIQTDTDKITHKEINGKYYHSDLAQAFKECIKKQYKKYFDSLPENKFLGWKSPN